ncbi:hypothetical protein EDD29_0547 [Actinocorallia herbida]|uniref:Uncharacterized protein n=1 Tax=Actinocorallia herbida TaxID=58109 RepID=A0A3N1CQQ4_9ACTN|nr:hypothetical protein [Actinocorallia herbida]ROO83058.1 hypothetical protein EDD29_0547 [Actinocorallia herbida]
MGILRAGRRRPPGVFTGLLASAVLLWTAAAFWEVVGILLWLVLGVVTLVCWGRGVAAEVRPEWDGGERLAVILLRSALVPVLVCASLAVSVAGLPTRAAFAVSRPSLERAADARSGDTRIAGVLPAYLEFQDEGAVYYTVDAGLGLSPCGFLRLHPGKDLSDVVAAHGEHLSGPWHTYCYDPWESPFYDPAEDEAE